MKTFGCARCDNEIYFENVTCLACEAVLGFETTALATIALEPAAEGEGMFRGLGISGGPLYRYCANAVHGACNWLTTDTGPAGLCLACGLNRTIPNLSERGNLPAWRDFEVAKKRLLYSLLRYGLPLEAGAAGKGRLTFDFARNAGTGHRDGVITVDVLEADAVWRERQRQWFREPYRSLLGHLRHESGHFYWMVLVEAAGRIEDFRALFGDERSDYRSALDRHHAHGPPASWAQHHVSAYASTHPWEDWAETWAHYVHMTDALDTAEAEGMEPRSAGLKLGSAWPFQSYDIYREETLPAMMARWIPLSIAMNSLSRSMGHEDFYPFVIPAPAYDKLAFVHHVIREHARRG